MTTSRVLATLTILILVTAAACGDDGGGTATTSPESSPTPSTHPNDNADATPSATSVSPATPTPAPAETDAEMRLMEFAIQARRTAARPGTVTFDVSNQGDISHEFVVIRTDLGHANLPRLDDNRGADESQLDVVGRLEPIAPGASADLSIELASDTYVLICNLVTDSTSHYLSGMYTRFTISDDAPPPDLPSE